MNHLLARKKSSSSFRGKQSEAGSAAPSSTTPSDQKPREAKSSPYARPSYETVLATKGSFMGKFELGITDESKRLCRTLLEAEQSVPQETLFRDDLFEETCETVRARNEAMVVRDISPLICPSAQVLRIYGAKHLKPLNESVNEGWNSAIPFYGPRPQPDYSVGFGRSAFTDDQLEKLRPFVGEVTDIFTSYFMATWQMYFPFLTCEVKCGAAALDIADRQNAHSMTLAVRGTVELFRLVKREKELHREILAFSISHDHRTVRIYGHYPVIDGKKTTFYRHPIHTFDFTALDGKEKWTAYKFTKNVYDIWMPTHLERICSVIDDLPPDLDFEVSQQSELGESGLSQGFENHYLSDQTSHDAASLREAGSQSSPVGSRDVPSDTSLSQRTEGGEFKKPKKRARS
ncbi:reverse transcriptase protein [Rutstroemia sp. NJR-2017a WRK4]|nr:reverse transcriptase protein [Rutstroemia sp. NJR-2017a WRK4]